MNTSKFYTASKNNSGGYFIDNNDVCEYVIIEANSPKEASDKLDEIVENYSEYCECCGERWSNWFDDYDAKDKPSIYDKFIEEYEYGYYSKECIIYYLNGSKKRYNFETKQYKDI